MQGTGGAERKQGRARLEVGARARTLNMSSMLLMLERSKLSALLSVFAPCRVAREVIQSRARYWPGGERGRWVRWWCKRHAGKPLGWRSG